MLTCMTLRLVGNVLWAMCIYIFPVPFLSFSPLPAIYDIKWGFLAQSVQ